MMNLNDFLLFNNCLIIDFIKTYQRSIIRFCYNNHVVQFKSKNIVINVDLCTKFCYSKKLYFIQLYYLLF